MSDSLNIGQVARESGVSAKMIRHYETIGLLNEAQRTDAGYRVYDQVDIHRLRFIRQSRNLGFPMEQIKELLGLWQNQRRTSRKVKELALKHVAELDERIRELQEIKRTLTHLVDHCHGDDRPDCPILDGLAETKHAYHPEKEKNKKRNLKNNGK